MKSASILLAAVLSVLLVGAPAAEAKPKKAPTLTKVKLGSYFNDFASTLGVSGTDETIIGQGVVDIQACFAGKTRTTAHCEGFYMLHGYDTAYNPVSRKCVYLAVITTKKKKLDEVLATYPLSVDSGVKYTPVYIGLPGQTQCGGRFIDADTDGLPD